MVPADGPVPPDESVPFGDPDTATLLSPGLGAGADADPTGAELGAGGVAAASDGAGVGPWAGVGAPGTGGGRAAEASPGWVGGGASGGISPVIWRSITTSAAPTVRPASPTITANT